MERLEPNGNEPVIHQYCGMFECRNKVIPFKPYCTQCMLTMRSEFAFDQREANHQSVREYPAS